jgi:hypothetical protein
LRTSAAEPLASAQSATNRRRDKKSEVKELDMEALDINVPSLN